MSYDRKDNLLPDIRVLDFGRFIAAPFCTRILSDFGADVIKIEGLKGETIRRHPPFYHGGFSAVFTQYNAGKKSVCVNMRNTEGIELIKKLISVSDVVVENFRPGLMDKMGLGYGDLKKINEKVILCSISGFGRKGSEKDRSAYADIVHAYSGMDYMAMKVSGQGSEPPGLPYSFADTYAALNAAIAIMGALYYRKMTGEGQAIDISLLDCVLTDEWIHKSKY